MIYAHVVDGEIVEWGGLPFSARRLDTGEIVYDLAGASAKWRTAAGWFPVTETERPDVAAGEVAEPSVELVDGEPVQVWTVRPATGRERRRRDLTQQIAVLRQWSAEADAVTVTATNAVQVLGVVTDRLGVFFARFADLLDVLDLEER